MSGTLEAGSPAGGGSPRSAAGRAGFWRLLAAATALAVWLGLSIAWRPLALPDEGRYVGVAWEMVQRGDFVVPTLDGLPFFHKPPLFYWGAAAAMHLLGPHAWAARIVPWTAALVAVLAIAGFSRRWADPVSARRVPVVLATMPLFYGGAQYANMDMLVAGGITLTVVAAAHALLARDQGRPDRAAWAVAFAAAAAGVLAKGLIGIVLPAMVIGAWRLARRRPLFVVPWWAPLVFVVLALPWFLAVQQRHPEFAHYFVVVQHVKRFASGGFNNVQPFWFYLAVLALFTLPWSPWLLALVRRGTRPAGDGHADVRLLMLTWLLVVLVFFSIPRSKLVGYILPALPPLAWLVADATVRAFEPQRGERWFRAGAGFAAAVCLVLVTLAALRQPHSQQALAGRIAAERQPGDAVVFVGRYFYDVPVYARLPEPVTVVDDWAAADVAQDSWRRELTDAASFAAPAARRLVATAELPALLCRAPRTWVMTLPGASLPAGRPIDRNADAVLWRVDRGSDCGPPR